MFETPAQEAGKFGGKKLLTAHIKMMDDVSCILVMTPALIHNSRAKQPQTEEDVI